MCGIPYSVYRMVPADLLGGVAACTTGARPATSARAASRAVRRFMLNVFRRRVPGSCCAERDGRGERGTRTPMDLRELNDVLVADGPFVTVLVESESAVEQAADKYEL